MCLQPPVLLTLSGSCCNDSWNHQWQKPQPTAKGLTVSVDAHARELNVQPWNSNSWWINHDYNCSRVVSDWFGTMVDTKLIWYCPWIAVYHGHSIFHSWWVVSKVLSQIPNFGNFASGLKMYRCIIVMRLQGLSDYYFYIVTTDFSFSFCSLASKSSDKRFNCLEQKFRLCMTECKTVMVIAEVCWLSWSFLYVRKTEVASSTKLGHSLAWAMRKHSELWANRICHYGQLQENNIRGIVQY